MVALDAGQAHRLATVLRLKTGAEIALFNGRDGEWRATLEHMDKRGGTARITAQLRPQGGEPDLWLAFAPLKHARLAFLVEKACELGVSALLPVMTRRTQGSPGSRIRAERLRKTAIEAAEQCERLSVPRVAEPVALAALLTDWPADRRLLIAAERQGAPAIAEVAAGAHPGPLGVLVGPEGGFAPGELDVATQHANVSCVSLGPRILRAETAALAALAILQALSGDWRAPVTSVRRGRTF